jgi:hypothetical protein
VRFQVLTALKFRVFWDIAPCSDVEVVQIAQMMEAVCTSETSVDFNVTTRRYIPEGSNQGFLYLVF